MGNCINSDAAATLYSWSNLLQAFFNSLLYEGRFFPYYNSRSHSWSNFCQVSVIFSSCFLICCVYIFFNKDFLSQKKARLRRQHQVIKKQRSSLILLVKQLCCYYIIFLIATQPSWIAICKVSDLCMSDWTKNQFDKTSMPAETNHGREQLTSSKFGLHSCLSICEWHLEMYHPFL